MTDVRIINKETKKIKTVKLDLRRYPTEGGIMNTKEAIEFINELRDIDITCTANEYDKHIEQINETIALLKRGEKDGVID